MFVNYLTNNDRESRQSKINGRTIGPTSQNGQPRRFTSQSERKRSSLNNEERKSRRTQSYTPNERRESQSNSVIPMDPRIDYQPQDCVCGPNIFGRVLGPTVDEPILLGLATFLKMCDECPPQVAERPAVVAIQEPKQDNAESYDGVETEEEFDTTRQSLGIHEETEPELELEREPKFSKVESHSQAIKPMLESREFETELELDQEAESIKPPKVETQSQTIKPMVQSREFQTEEPVIEEEADDVQKDRRTSLNNYTNRGTEKPLDNLNEVAAKEETISDPEPTGQQESNSEEEEEVEKEKEIKSDSYSLMLLSDTSSGTYSKKGSCGCTNNLASEYFCSCNVKKPENTCICKDSDRKYYSNPNSLRSADSRRTSIRSSKKASSRGLGSIVTSSRYSKSIGDSDATKISKYSSKELVKRSCLCTTSSSDTPSSADTEIFAKGECQMLGVRYAITKITKFSEYTTFEVLKSTRKKPRVMPKTLEGVFVLRNKKTNSNNCQ